MSWRVRTGGAADAPVCREIYIDAVHNGTAPLYTTEQAEAWAPPDEPADWLAPRLEDGETWIGETKTRAVGFLTVTRRGHLDLFFVLPDYRRKDLAADLYAHMEDWLRVEDIREPTTYASHLARRFLERRGWRVVERETTQRNGVEIDRWKMLKHLTD